MKTSILAVTGAAALALTVLGSPSAFAYDADAYAYAAGHMLSADDLPSALGSFTDNMYFNASQSTSSIPLCSIDDSSVDAPGGELSFSAGFAEKGDGNNYLSQQVTQYSSALTAVKAFNKLKKNAKTCTGTASGTWTDDDGTIYTWNSTRTNGKVPKVTVLGVESVFVNTNYVDGSSTADSPSASDTYQVFTLLGDVIISTIYSTGSDDNVSTAKRKKVNGVAFTAIDRWLD